MRRGTLEVVYVDVRMERQQLLAQLNRRCSQGTARDVYDLVEVVGSSRWIQIGPQRIDELLTMQPVSRSEG